MAHFDPSIDYFELLELEPEEVAGLGIEGLRTRIKQKKKEWTAKEIVPFYQQEARYTKERLRQLEELLDEPDALAAYVKHAHGLRADKRLQQEEEVRRLIAIATGERKDMTPRQRDLIKVELRALKIPEGMLNPVLRTLGINLCNPQVQTAANPTLPKRTPAMDRAVLSEINNWLKVLGKPNLYALLELPQNSPPNRLVAAAKGLYARWSKVLPKTCECTAWEKTLQASLTYLKEAEAKARYDRALFNQRIDQFVQRIDLVLAGPAVGRPEQLLLTRMGVEDFGLDNEVVQECIAARIAEKGVLVEQPVAFTVQCNGLVQCRACFAWSDFKLHRNCRQCGSPLQQKCPNPYCGQAVKINDKVCPHCRLSLTRGRQYVTLLQLADSFLHRGSAAKAQEACEVARQILPAPEIDKRLAQANHIRLLVASVRTNVAKKAWNKVYSEMQQLLQLAPRLKQPGIPRLESVTKYIVSAREQLHGIAADADPTEAARLCLGWLGQWTDFEEAYQKLRQLCQVLESQQKYRIAWQLACKLLGLRPSEKNLPPLVAQLEERMRRAEAVRDQVAEAQNTLAVALKERRLYAAEKVLQVLEQFGAADELSEAAVVQRLLTEIRAELQEVGRTAVAGTGGDLLIDRYTAILDRCHDCREALQALNSLTPDPPAAPRNLIIRQDGPRRVLSWEAAEVGKPPTGYVVQRSLSKPGASSEEQALKTIYEGTELQYRDEESAPCGSILRYTVHAVCRGRLQAGGTLLRDYEAASPPINAPSLLIWQEVHSLHLARRAQGMHLFWYQPAAVRQVRIKRWMGKPEECTGEPVLLSPNQQGTFTDTDVQPNQVYTYRVLFVYEGPEGEFVTPGMLYTDASVPTLPSSNGASGIAREPLSASH